MLVSPSPNPHVRLAPTDLPNCEVFVNSTGRAAKPDSGVAVNDAIGGGEPVPVEVPEYVARMAELTDQLLADGAERVILLTAPRNFGFWGTPTVQARLHSYAEAVRSLCEPAGDNVACGPDLHEELGPGDFAPGNVHPSGPAHEWIATDLASIVPEPQFAGWAALCALVCGYYWRKG